MQRPGTDVLIVGAGPVGLLLACELARRDVAVRVLDKLAAPTSESRALAIHARSLEMLARVGVVDRMLAAGRRAVGMQMHADGELLADLALDTVDSPYPFSLMLPQTETEAILTARLQELGGTIERGAEVVDLAQDDSGVRCTVRHGGGREEGVASRYVVGTDGSRSTVRARIGLELEGSFKGERFLLADVEAEYELDRDHMHTFFTEDGPLLVFPMAGDRVRVMAEIPDQPGPEPTLEAVQQVTDQRAGGIRLTTAHWLAEFEIHHAQVPRYRVGSVFLAGDAAHVHSPAGGQGMNTGMQDAFNLGWKLALAVQDRAAPLLLDSYHEERHPIAARVINQTTSLTRIGTLHHRHARDLRNRALHFAAGLAPVRTRLADQTEEMTIEYRLSPIVADDPHHHRHTVRAGDAAPDVVLEDGGTLHSLLAGDPGHSLLYAGEDPPLDAIAAPPGGPVAERYALVPGALVAVRPDGYLGLVSSGGGRPAVESYLQGIHG